MDPVCNTLTIVVVNDDLLPTPCFVALVKAPNTLKDLVHFFIQKPELGIKGTKVPLDLADGLGKFHRIAIGDDTCWESVFRNTEERWRRTLPKRAGPIGVQAVGAADDAFVGVTSVFLTSDTTVPAVDGFGWADLRLRINLHALGGHWEGGGTKRWGDL